MSGSIHAAFTQERDTLTNDKPSTRNIDYESNSSGDISDLVSQLNTQMGVLNYKRAICQAIGFCFLFTILLLSASFFIAGLSVFFLVDFGNIVQGPYLGQLVEKLCFQKGGIDFCRGRVLLYKNGHIYLSVDEYPADSNVWPPFTTDVSVYLNKRETEMSLLPIIRYNPIGIVISSATIFGLVLLIALIIIGVAFSVLASRKKKKIKYYEKSSSSWIKSFKSKNDIKEDQQQPTKSPTQTTANVVTSEDQPILDATSHPQYNQ